MKKILLIDDDADLLLTLSDYLNTSGYSVFQAKNGQEGIDILNRSFQDISLVITDIIMPIIGGVEVCKIIKETKNFKHLPVLMLTTMSDISNKFIGFSAGADDYLTKPFELLELLLRVQVLLKRNNNEAEINNINPKAIQMNKNDFTVTIRNQNIYLSPLEFDLLYYLYLNSDRLISIEEIFQQVFKYPPNTGNSDTIRAHIKNIRSKIEENPSEPKLITNIPKRGYMLNTKN